MCGRYTHRLTWRQIHALYRLTAPPAGDGTAEPAPRYNIAPSQAAPVIRAGDDGGRALAMLRWGLLPSWAKELKDGPRPINARSETVATTPMFRAAFRKRRCLVPADGFYEWQERNGGKQPWFIFMKDGTPFALAGLWERWEGAEEVIESYTILTCVPNALCAPLHDRMPVILDREDHDAWLASEDITIPLALLAPYPADRMQAWPVSRRVGNPRNNDPSLVEPLQDGS